MTLRKAEKRDEITHAVLTFYLEGNWRTSARMTFSTHHVRGARCGRSWVWKSFCARMTRSPWEGDRITYFLLEHCSIENFFFFLLEKKGFDFLVACGGAERIRGTAFARVFDLRYCIGWCYSSPCPSTLIIRFELHVLLCVVVFFFSFFLNVVCFVACFRRCWLCIDNITRWRYDTHWR